MSVREQFARLAAASGLSDVELARRTGKNSTWIFNRRTGRAGITADDVPILARALGLPIMAFYADAPTPSSSEVRMENEHLSAAEEAILAEIGLAARDAMVRHRRSLRFMAFTGEGDDLDARDGALRQDLQPQGGGDQ